MLFLCRCFDLQKKELGLTDGPQLQRAISKRVISKGELSRVYDKLQNGIDEKLRPIGINSVTEQLVSVSLNLYERIRPQLRTSGLSRKQVLSVLVEHFFVPTAYAVMLPRCRPALGTEYQGEKSWYLPSITETGLQMPVQRVLDCWLRTAGFKTAYGVSKKLIVKSKFDEALAKRWEAWKRSVKECLNGKRLPPLRKLHQLVDAFPDHVAWLDDAESWRNRFTLAFAVQKACEKLDALCPNTSPKLAAMVQAVREERVVGDDNNVLTDPWTFFATRLIQRHLKQTKQWDEIRAKVPSSIERCYNREVSYEEMERQRKEDLRQLNIGNHLLEFISDQAAFKSRKQQCRTRMEEYTALNEFILELGVEDLNRLLDEKRKASKRKTC